MSSPESSPVHQLVACWWREGELPRHKEVTSRRRELLLAAMAEFEWKQGHYDITSDARVIWASHWLNRAENRAFRIDPNIRARAAFEFDMPLTPCGKDRAVGST